MFPVKSGRSLIHFRRPWAHFRTGCLILIPWIKKHFKHVHFDPCSSTWVQRTVHYRNSPSTRNVCPVSVRPFCTRLDNFILEHYQFDPTRKWLWRRNVKSSSKLLFTFERFFKRKVERKTTFIATYNARANRISSLLINYYYGKYMSHEIWVICGDLFMQDSQNHDMR